MSLLEVGSYVTIMIYTQSIFHLTLKQAEISFGLKRDFAPASSRIRDMNAQPRLLLLIFHFALPIPTFLR